MEVTDSHQILERIKSDPRYLENLDWGKPRSGHPEGTIRSHIAELEQNLQRLRSRLFSTELALLPILIHVHDTFKPDAKQGAAITSSQSHASLARAFLAEFVDDIDLLAMVQFHDEPYALFQQWKHKKTFSTERLQFLFETISNWDLFIAFLIIDNCTAGKSREPLLWFFQQIPANVQTRFTVQDILP